MKKPNEIEGSDIFDELLKTMPIKERIKVSLEMHWLTLNIVPNRTATDDELEKAHKWADETSDYILTQFNQWEKDGRP